PSLNWGVAIILPTSIIDAMLPWCDKQRYPNYDRRIGRYCIDVLNMPTMCTWPSLVDHREIPSLVGHGAGRTAHHFIAKGASALEVSGDGRVVSTPTAIASAGRRALQRGPGAVSADCDVTSGGGRSRARSLRGA